MAAWGGAPRLAAVLPPGLDVGSELDGDVRERAFEGDDGVLLDGENDSESSSVYTIDRNLSGSMGRFILPNPSDGSYDFTNPQSLN